MAIAENVLSAFNMNIFPQAVRRCLLPIFSVDIIKGTVEEIAIPSLKIHAAVTLREDTAVKVHLFTGVCSVVWEEVTDVAMIEGKSIHA
ncbi:hypothetical protein D1872_214290 [compost metagenome]